MSLELWWLLQSTCFSFCTKQPSGNFHKHREKQQATSQFFLSGKESLRQVSCDKTREGEGNYEEDSRVMGLEAARGRSHLPLTRTAWSTKPSHCGGHKQPGLEATGPRGTNYSHVMMIIHYNCILSVCSVARLQHLTSCSLWFWWLTMSKM